MQQADHVVNPPELLPNQIDLTCNPDTSVQLFLNQEVAIARLARQEVIPYAYVRFANEAITLRACLESILPFCDRGIISYHEPLPGVAMDDSLAIAQEFVREHRGFRLVKYPVPVIFHDCEFVDKHLFSGVVSRYWLMDCYSNYALEHLKELARANGEYDRAYIFKVDADHIYCREALEVCRREAYRVREWQDAIVFTKYNVCVDQNLLAHYYSTYNSWWNKLKRWWGKGTQAPINTYFLGHNKVAYDHWMIRLDKLTHFNFIHISDPENPQQGFQNFERAKFAPGTRFNLQRCFVNSYHLTREKLHAYDRMPSKAARVAEAQRQVELEKQRSQLRSALPPGAPDYAQYALSASDNPTGSKVVCDQHQTSEEYAKRHQYHSLAHFMDKLPRYQGWSEQDCHEHAEEYAANPQFWSPAHLETIVRSLKYRYVQKQAVDTRSYLRTAADFEMLLSNPDYRLENYLKKFNQARHDNTDRLLAEWFNLEARVLHKLIQELTHDIERYKSAN